MIAALMIRITFIFQFLSLSHASNSSKAIIIGFETLVLNVVGHLFFKESMRRRNTSAGTLCPDLDCNHH